jgi:hypothetical protein
MESKRRPFGQKPEISITEYLKTLSPQELERIATHALNQSKRRTKSPLVPDKINSTYWWVINMNPDQKVEVITGYSKFEGFNEARNADDTLASKIEMLYKRGYFHRSRRITIYKRLGAMCNIETDQTLLEISPDNWIYYGESKNIELFITNFRNRIENGIAPKVHLRPISRG